MAVFDAKSRQHDVASKNEVKIAYDDLLDDTRP